MLQISYVVIIRSLRLIFPKIAKFFKSAFPVRILYDDSNETAYHIPYFSLSKIFLLAFSGNL